jgi:predicted enzyme related to lactoylglutathione lyase
MKKFIDKIHSFIEEMGEPLKSGMSGEILTYWIKWEDLKKEQKRRGLNGGDDVRMAKFVLDQLGIKNNYVEVDDTEENDWVVYWR